MRALDPCAHPDRQRRPGCAARRILRAFGHRGYDPPFGFAPGVRVGLDCEYDVPAEAFMVLERRPGALRSASGRVQYHAAFARL